MFSMFGVTTSWGANRALLVGIADYGDEEIMDLPGIKQDLRIMKEVVQSLGYNDEDVLVLADRRANRLGIEQAIEQWLIKGTGPDDRVLIYYSGHGTQIEDLDGDEEDQVDEALVPYDAQLGDDGSLISDDRFNELLSKIPARETFVLIDACHSGTATKGISLFEDGYRIKFTPWPGIGHGWKGRFEIKSARKDNSFAALSACRDDQKAISAYRGSLFTLGLQEAVRISSSKELSLLEAKEIADRFIAQELGARKDLVHNPVVSGSEQLHGKSIFLRQTEQSPATVSIERSKLWQDLAELAARADYEVVVTPNKMQHRIGELIELNIDVVKDGYLNIINLGSHENNATILFPNRFVQDNWVKSGQTIRIPGSGGSFKLTAQGPPSETLVVVFLTESPLNLWEEGTKQLKSIFSSLDEKGFRSYVVEAAEPTPTGTTVGAAVLITSITE